MQSARAGTFGCSWSTMKNVHGVSSKPHEVVVEIKGLECLGRAQLNVPDQRLYCVSMMCVA
eukprot:11389524-Prorocentrum_lima.AAC.1